MVQRELVDLRMEHEFGRVVLGTLFSTPSPSK